MDEKTIEVEKVEAVDDDGIAPVRSNSLINLERKNFHIVISSGEGTNNFQVIKRSPTSPRTPSPKDSLQLYKIPSFRPLSTSSDYLSSCTSHHSITDANEQSPIEVADNIAEGGLFSSILKGNVPLWSTPNSFLMSNDDKSDRVMEYNATTSSLLWAKDRQMKSRDPDLFASIQKDPKKLSKEKLMEPTKQFSSITLDFSKNLKYFYPDRDAKQVRSIMSNRSLLLNTLCGQKNCLESLQDKLPKRRRFKRSSTISTQCQSMSTHTSILSINEEIPEQNDQKNPEELYHYIIRVIRSMIWLCKCLRSYIQNKEDLNQQSLQQLNYYSMETVEFTAEKMVFSKASFARSNMHIPSWAKVFLSLPPSKRNIKDIERLAAMLKALRFFKKSMDDRKLEDLCRYSKYAQYEKQRILIQSGHSSVFGYFLLSGSLFVNIEDISQSNRKKFIRTAAVLEKGSLFGEISIFHQVPRTATIITRENIECLVIDANVCLEIFQKEMNKEFRNRLHHMKQCSIFVGWPHTTLRDLCLVSKQLEFQYNEVIVKDTATSESIYIVAKGRVEVMYRFTITESPNSKPPDGVVPIKELIKTPPNHLYLPPLPISFPPLLCQKEVATAMAGQRDVLVSIESVYPYECCDMLSIIKCKRSLPLILVSKGCEIIRIPKSYLQTIPPAKIWKLFLEEVRKSPRYPSDHVLSRLYLEHHQWLAYRKIVLQDTLKSKGFCKHLLSKKVTKNTNKTPVKLEKEGTNKAEKNEKNYHKCLSYEEPLFDGNKHKHHGPCIRGWLDRPVKKGHYDRMMAFSKKQKLTLDLK